MSKVLVPIAEGVEELEAVTIIDLLRRAEIDVVVASLKQGPVKASRGVVLLADMDLEQALEQEYDMVVLPGGAVGSDNLNNDERISELLKVMADSERFTAAICAAPKVLAGAGVLKGHTITAFPGVMAEVSDRPFTDSGAAVVKDRNIITSRGPGTAMDFALALIAELAGSAKRDEVESQLKR